MKKTAPFRHWTPEEDHHLALFLNEKTNIELSIDLDRNENAIHYRLNALKLNRDSDRCKKVQQFNYGHLQVLS